MNKFKSIFKKDKNIIIGAVHLAPLLGFKDFPGNEIILKNALKDSQAFINGGADAVIYENNYDLPHIISIEPGQMASMVYVGEKLRAQIKKPFGVSVLWNDFNAALAIAVTNQLQFIRIPVFVDKVKTSYGTVTGNPVSVKAAIKKMAAEDIAIFTDIHVKHAKLLSKHSLVQSAKLAIKNGSDAIILTGKWTGDLPDINELKLLRKSVGKFPILLGSGVDAKNAKELFKYSNGAIVSTALKADVKDVHKINVKPYSSRISIKKVKALRQAIGK